MISPVRSGPMIVKAVQGRRSIKVGRIYWKSRFWLLSLEWMSEGVMDDDGGDGDKDELTSEWGGESRHDWRGWRNESEGWFQRRSDA